MSYDFPNEINRSYFSCFKEDALKKDYKKRKSSLDIAILIESLFDEKMPQAKDNIVNIINQITAIIENDYEMTSELIDLWNKKKNNKTFQSKETSVLIQELDESINRNNSNSTISTPKDNNNFRNNYSTLSPSNLMTLKYDGTQYQPVSSFGRASSHQNDPFDFLALNSNSKSSMKLSIGPQILYSDYFANEECEGVNIVYNDKKDIMFISIDLLLEKIAISPSFDKDNNIKEAFIRHYSKFISTEMLIEKLLNAFDYFMNIYNFDEESLKNNTGFASSPGILPIGLIAFINKIIVKKYEKEISKSQVYKTKLKSFYQFLSVNPLFNIEFEDVLEKMDQLFDLTTEEEITELIYQLKERKNFKLYTINSTFDGDNPDIHEGIFHIDDWTPKEIALQLTSITIEMMNKIDEKELLFGHYISESKRELSPNIIALIERFDKLSYYIIEEILSYDKKGKRAETIEMFIDIAYELKILHNYNDCMNIKSSLNHIIIKSLSKTWSVVQDSSMKKLGKLDKVLSLNKNFENLKEKMRTSIKYKTPYIPYLGLTLREISFLEERSKYVHKENMMINISKIVQINAKIDEFFQYKNNVLLITPIPGLEILNKLNPKRERDLEELGKRLEPLFTRAIKKQYVKRFTNTDLLFTKNIKFNGCISLKKSCSFLIENDYYY